MKALVTGGAGFIGSHLSELLLEEGWSVSILDDMSTGKSDNIDLLRRKGKGKLSFIEGDCRDADAVRGALKGMDLVYHLAAFPEVRTDQNQVVFDRNVLATYVLSQEVAKSKAQGLVFASTSTVYGEPSQIPTPETYGPLLPISYYGATKLACEALISAAFALSGKSAAMIRFANAVGARATHGVAIDFINKLKRDGTRLEVLGDGTQKKSYIHVSDCARGMVAAGRVAVRDRSRAIYNLGTGDSLGVLEIAKIVAKAMGKGGAKIQCTGGVDGGRGWPGDVKVMLLDTRKATREMGWSPLVKTSRKAVELAVRDLLAEN